jgi:hypothetical protein
MGEWEKALALARTVFLNSQNRQFLIRSRLLEAQIEAFFFAENSGTSPAGLDAGGSLSTLLEEEGFEAYKPAIYYTLWKLSGAEDWKDRLLGEYPRSPEGRIAAAESGKAAVSAAPMPLWLLFPGRGGALSSPETAAGEPAKAPPASPEASAGEPAAGPVLQAGLFSSEANALELAERLRRAGFSPRIGRRAVKGREYYAVTLPPGGDINKTIRELAGAGFESFPVF